MIVILLLSLLLPSGAYSQGSAPQGAEATSSGPSSVADAAGVDELVNILVQKGVLKQEDVAAAMQKKENPADHLLQS